mgnify:CR=1 FL=1|tara:strand:+ start:925 stop:2250 length:1326 start_codon:yes stop_codon:yes gene_type:complete
MSKIEVNTVDVQCGSTLTLGSSGKTVTLASGASQTGFGRTGTVDWQTSSIKTATFTAANGEGYFANTSGGAFTMNLPAGTAGNIVSVVDYTNTFQTNALTVAPNGSQKIGGIAAANTLTTEGQSVTFVYVDDTEGWKNIQDSTSNVIGNPFLVATGGTVTTSGNCKIHTFTGPGTFTVCAISTNCAAENTVSYVVVAGGGAGGGASTNTTGGAGGGGAGGYREVKTPLTPYTASPLDGYPSAPNRITVTATAYPITVGGGGTGNPVNQGGSGSNSIFSTITSAGGGGGGAFGGTTAGADGGSGGGTSQSGSAGAGNTPPVSPPQGNSGGSGSSGKPGGGGGSTQAGQVSGSSSTGGGGGNGATSCISASPVTRGGGGGGGAPTSGNGGPGGGGNGGPNNNAVAGTTNTGGGGGGNSAAAGGPNSTGAAGGSGIVIIRYKFQ